MTNETTFLEQNFHAIAAVLRQANLDRVTASYFGSGDSGSISDVVLYQGDAIAKVSVKSLPEVTYQFSTYECVKGEFHQVLTDTTADFKSAVEDLVENALEEVGFEGWETEDGGDGHLTIYSDGRAELVHDDHNESPDSAGEPDDTDFSSNDEGAVGNNIRVLAKVLVDAGIVSLTVDYSGSGDSGNGFEVSFEGDQSVLAQEVTVLEEDDGDEHTMDVDTAIRDLTELAIVEAGHEGYECDAGGCGTFRLRADGTATLSHKNYLESGTLHEFSWNDPTKASKGAEV